MRVQIQWRPGTDLMDIWLIADGFGGERQQSVLVGENKWEWRGLSEGDRPDPSFSLPGDVLADIVAEAGKIPQPSAALANHLADTIKVRDRLLDKVVPPK